MLLIESENLMEKKYEIIKNGIDDYTLKYKDKEINFKSKVKLVEKMQEVNKTARVNMMLDLAEKGKNIKDLVKEQKKDGKTYYDNSLKEEIEKIYIEEETGKVFMKEIEEMLGIGLQELINEIGLDEKEITEFSTELGQAMIGNFPS